MGSQTLFTEDVIRGKALEVRDEFIPQQDNIRTDMNLHSLQQFKVT